MAIAARAMLHICACMLYKAKGQASTQAYARRANMKLFIAVNFALPEFSLAFRRLKDIGHAMTTKVNQKPPPLRTTDYGQDEVAIIEVGSSNKQAGYHLSAHMRTHGQLRCEGACAPSLIKAGLEDRRSSMQQNSSDNQHETSVKL